MKGERRRTGRGVAVMAVFGVVASARPRNTQGGAVTVLKLQPSAGKSQRQGRVEATGNKNREKKSGKNRKTAGVSPGRSYRED